MSELKNCPLCGNLLEIVRKNGSKYVRCISGICIFETARHGYHISDDELIKRCNRRPAEDVLTEEVERLKGELADRDIEGYAGFVIGVDQMKKKLAEKDKEIERLKRELKLADSAAELTCLKLESEVKKLKAVLFGIANFGKGQPFKFRTKAEYIDNFRLIQKMAKDVLNKYTPDAGKMEEN